MRVVGRRLHLSAGRASALTRWSATTTTTTAASSSARGAMISAAHCTPVANLHTSPVHRAAADVPDELAKDLQEIIQHDRLVVFLTGTPQQPRCRFTVQLVDLFHQLGIKYSFFNIMDDDEVCEGLKLYSEWPTYPQVYVDGELLGGYDICKNMMLDGSLTRMLKEKNLM